MKISAEKGGSGIVPSSRILHKPPSAGKTPESKKRTEYPTAPRLRNWLPGPTANPAELRDITCFWKITYSFRCMAPGTWSHGTWYLVCAPVSRLFTSADLRDCDRCRGRCCSRSRRAFVDRGRLNSGVGIYRNDIEMYASCAAIAEKCSPGRHETGWLAAVCARGEWRRFRILSEFRSVFRKISAQKDWLLGAFPVKI